MSGLSAARIVLEDSPEPLCAEAIYRRMAERGLWSNPHKHPESTVAAAISSEIGRHGAGSQFLQASDRAFAIRARRSP